MTTLKHARSAEAMPVSYTVSGFFTDESAVHDSMWDCLRRGVPRDLMDVAVSRGAAGRYFGGRYRTSQRDSWFSWAGRGALAGLLISAAVTLIIVMLPGFNTSTSMAFVQLLGPDIGVILGGALGGLYGWFKPSDVQPQFRRALERPDAALMLVHLQPKQEAEAIREILARRGAEAIKIESDSARSVGAE